MNEGQTTDDRMNRRRYLRQVVLVAGSEHIDGQAVRRVLRAVKFGGKINTNSYVYF